MGSPSDPRAPTSTRNSAKKVDLITLPTTALLIGCVVGALGYSKQSELLTWQIPLAMLTLAIAYTAFRVLRARS